MKDAAIGLGSNVGDRLLWIRKGIDAISASVRIQITATSSIFETVPVGPPQPDFLNAVVTVTTDLGANELLAELKGIEAKLGRSLGDRWGPREIDLDLLLFDHQEIDTEELKVPHPRLHQRAFALIPLLEIEPDAMLPGGQRLDSFEVDDSGVSLFATLGCDFYTGKRPVSQVNWITIDRACKKSGLLNR